MEAEREVLEAYQAALRAGDTGRLSELFTDDVIVEWPQSGERFEGKQACLRIYSEYPGSKPQFDEPERVIGRDGLWITEAQAEYPGGRMYRVVSVHEFRDGLISHEIDYFAEDFPIPEWRRGWAEAS